MKNEIEPLPPTGIDGIAGREQLKQLEERVAKALMGVDVGSGSARIVMIKARHTGQTYLRDLIFGQTHQPCPRKHVDSKVVEPKQIEGESVKSASVKPL